MPLLRLLVFFFFFFSSGDGKECLEPFDRFLRLPGIKTNNKTKKLYIFRDDSGTSAKYVYSPMLQVPVPVLVPVFAFAFLFFAGY